MPALDHLADTPAVHELYPMFSGHLAFDIGANGGSVSRILAKHFDDVVACEPGDSFDTLITSPPDNVRPLHVAVSEEVGTVTLASSVKSERIGELVTYADSPIEGSWGPSIGDREVRSVTLDFMAEMYGTPDFVKVDVEGHETYVIRGGSRLFAHHSPMLLIEIHKSSFGVEIRALLAGYHWTRIDNENYSAESNMREHHYWLLGKR